MRACSLPDDFTPLPPPQINYRSRESGEGVAAPRPRHTSRSQACPSVNTPGMLGIKLIGRSFCSGVFPEENATSSLGGREREARAGNALKQAVQLRPPHPQ